jgi:hypothetical protein
MTQPVKNNSNLLLNHQPNLKVSEVNAPQGNLRLALKKIEELESLGKLPENGKITLITSEEAQKEIQRLNNLPNRPDCTPWGYTKAIIGQALKEQEIPHKKEPIEKLDLDLAKNRYQFLAKELEQAIDGITLLRKGKIVTTLATGINGLIVIQHAVEAGMDAYDDHSRHCTQHEGAIGLTKTAAKTVIATVKYATKPPTTSDQPFPSPQRIDVSKTKSNQPAKKVQEISKPEKGENPSQKPGSNNDRSPVDSNSSNGCQEPPLDPASGQPEPVPQETPPHKPSEKAPKPQVRFVLDPNLQHPKKTAAKLEADLYSDTKLSVTVEPANIRRSTLHVGVAHEGANGSVAFNPRKPERTVITGSYSQGVLSGGVHVPIKKTKNTQVSMGGKLGENYEGKLIVAPHDPLKARVQFNAIVPIYGVPVKFSADALITRPEDLKLAVGLPTFGLDKVIPGVPESITVLYLNMQKIRRRVRSIGNKAAKAIGIGKKPFGSNKNKLKRAMERQKAIENFLSLSRSQQHLDALSKDVSPSLLEDPKIYSALVGLNNEMEAFIHELSNLPTVDNVHVEQISLDPIFDECEALLAQMSRLVEEQASNSDAILTALTELNAQAEQASTLLGSLEEAIDALLVQAERTVDSIEACHRSVAMLERSTQELSTHADQVANSLRTVDRSVLQEFLLRREGSMLK